MRIKIPLSWIVALQAVGGAAGNVICVHNVAASAVVGLVGKEDTIIRKTFPVFLYYASMAGAIGYAIVWTSSKGWLNLGAILIASILGVLIAIVLAAIKKNSVK